MYDNNIMVSMNEKQDGRQEEFGGRQLSATPTMRGKTCCACDRSTVRRSYKRKTQGTVKHKETVATRPSVMMLCPCSLIGTSILQVQIQATVLHNDYDKEEVETPVICTT